MKKTIKLLLSCSILFGLSVASADMLELKDGRLLNGTYQGGTAATMRFESAGKMEVIPLDTILALTISRPAGSAQTPVAPPPQASAQTSVAQASATQGAVQPIPAGTEMVIQLRSTLSTASARPGSKFDAILKSDLRSGSTLIAPQGSIVRGTVTSVTKPRRLNKSAALFFTLDEVLVGNSVIRMKTNTNGIQTGPDGAVVKGAARGAAIGAIAGGSSGDAAWAGAGLAAMRKGDEITIPTSALIPFKLTAPLQAPQ